MELFPATHEMNFACAQASATNAVLGSDSNPTDNLSFLSQHLLSANNTIIAKMDSLSLPDISKMAITTPSPIPDGHDCAHCHGHGNMACKGCLLVVYCNRECQVAHWKEHKKYCKSPLTKADWRPQWEVEQRKRVWTTERQKFLWGNVPALDFINLASNEGVDCKHDLKLLFAGTPVLYPMLEYALTSLR
jgi:hypothetical protein